MDKHTKIVRALEAELYEDGAIFHIEEPFSIKVKGCRVNGEIDVGKVFPGEQRAEVYEVKSNDRTKSRHKAGEQCQRDRWFMKAKYGITNVDSYYVHGDGDGYKKIKIE